MEADYELIDNEERHQYEFHVDKYTPKIEYIKSTNGQPVSRKSIKRYRKTRT